MVLVFGDNLAEKLEQSRFLGRSLAYVEFPERRKWFIGGWDTYPRFEVAGGFTRQQFEKEHTDVSVAEQFGRRLEIGQ